MKLPAGSVVKSYIISESAPLMILQLMRPSPNSIYNCNNRKRIKFFTRLRLVLEHLREHEFKLSFHFAINSSQGLINCSCPQKCIFFPWMCFSSKAGKTYSICSVYFNFLAFTSSLSFVFHKKVFLQFFLNFTKRKPVLDSYISENVFTKKKVNASVCLFIFESSYSIEHLGTTFVFF